MWKDIGVSERFEGLAAASGTESCSFLTGIVSVEQSITRNGMAYRITLLLGRTLVFWPKDSDSLSASFSESDRRSGFSRHEPITVVLSSFGRLDWGLLVRKVSSWLDTY